MFSPTGLVNYTFLVFFASFAPLRLCAQNNLAINGSRDDETAVPIARILFLNLYHYLAGEWLDRAESPSENEIVRHRVFERGR